MRFLGGTPDKPQTGNKPNRNDNNNLIANLRPSPPTNGGDQKTQSKAETAHGDSHAQQTRGEDCAVFKEWKGEEANEVLRAACAVSNGDKDFILTMYAENGTFELTRKHPRNKNGTYDYALGLNYKYHKPMIDRILNNQVTVREAVQYHYDIYINGMNSKRKTSCGVTPFCGYNVRNKNKTAFIFKE